jgi:diketogulonate reductase-like aldo/keto reductase
VLARVAKESGKTEAQIALNWLIAKDGVIAIPKASTAGHAVEDCGASGWRPSQSEYNRLELKIKYKRRGRIESVLQSWGRNTFQLLGKRL